MKNWFKKGDKVEATETSYNNCVKGNRGTVMDESEIPRIKWDDGKHNSVRQTRLKLVNGTMNGWVSFEDEQPPVGVPIMSYCPRALEGFEYVIIKFDENGAISTYDRREDDYTMYQPHGYKEWGITHWMRPTPPMFAWEYSLSANTMWCSFDSGTVWAPSKEEAILIAKDRLDSDFAEVNSVLNSELEWDASFGVDLSEIVVKRKV